MEQIAGRIKRTLQPEHLNINSSLSLEGKGKHITEVQRARERPYDPE